MCSVISESEKQGNARKKLHRKNERLINKSSTFFLLSALAPSMCIYENEILHSNVKRQNTRQYQYGGLCIRRENISRLSAPVEISRKSSLGRRLISAECVDCVDNLASHLF